MANTKSVEVVRINQIDADTEEVFLYRDEPYVNEVKRVKAGTYKVGPLVEVEEDTPEEEV